jgi:predicted RNase H-like nuclease
VAEWLNAAVSKTVSGVKPLTRVRIPPPPLAVGVDWYKAGWVAVVLGRGDAPEVVVEADLAALIDGVPGAACVAVDMPIGLPETFRASDQAARDFVGVRRNSVFMTPPRAVLEAASYAEANEIAAELLGGKKISRQAWALRDNIAVVAAVAGADARVIEVHPEVSFRAMTGREVGYAKTTWNGQAIRRAALAKEGIVLPGELEAPAGGIPVADVLDAAAAAWSARRHARGESKSLPDGWDRGEHGAIWY